MNKEEKIYCVHNLASLVIDELLMKFPNTDPVDLFRNFYGSRTYKKLCDVDTRLWAEGPIYIMNMYLKEIHKE